MWETLELADRDQARVRVPVGKGWYTARLDQHMRAVSDEETLYASVLIHSYALVESAAADALSQPRVSGGIEGWGQNLLDLSGKAWSDVQGGKAGAIEGAAVRNAFAHGTRTISASDAGRLSSAGVVGRAAGSPVTLTYDQLRAYRGQLQNLLNVAGLGFHV